MFSGNGSGKNGKGARRPTILLIDEMDQLVNKTQVGLQTVGWCGSLSTTEGLLGTSLCGSSLCHQNSPQHQHQTKLPANLKPSFNSLTVGGPGAREPLSLLFCLSSHISCSILPADRAVQPVRLAWSQGLPPVHHRDCKHNGPA